MLSYQKFVNIFPDWSKKKKTYWENILNVVICTAGQEETIRVTQVFIQLKREDVFEGVAKNIPFWIMYVITSLSFSMWSRQIGCMLLFVHFSEKGKTKIS